MESVFDIGDRHQLIYGGPQYIYLLISFSYVNYLLVFLAIEVIQFLEANSVHGVLHSTPHLVKFRSVLCHNHSPGSILQLLCTLASDQSHICTIALQYHIDIGHDLHQALIRIILSLLIRTIFLGPFHPSLILGLLLL